MGLYFNILYGSNNTVSYMDDSSYNTKEAYNAGNNFVYNTYMFVLNTGISKCHLYQLVIYFLRKENKVF